MKNIKLLSLLLLGNIAVSPLHAAGQKRQAPGSDEPTAKRLRTEAPEHKVADGWDGFVDADDQVLPDAHEDSSFNDTDEKRVVANRVAPEQHAAADQAEAGSLNPCTNCQYQNDATATECGVCAYKPGEVIEQQVVQNHPKDKVVKARNAKHQKLDEGTQAPTPSHAHTFTFEAFFPNGGGCEDIFWVHGYEFLHIDDVYNFVKTNKTIHSAFFRTVLANYPQIRQVLLNGGDINKQGTNFIDLATNDSNLSLLHLLVKNECHIDSIALCNIEFERTPVSDNCAKFLRACQDICNDLHHKSEIQIINQIKGALTQGAYINCRSYAYGTIVHHAARNHQFDLLVYLLTIPEIDVNGVGPHGYTPLALACWVNYLNPGIIKLLLEFPAIKVDTDSTALLSPLGILQGMFYSHITNKNLLAKRLEAIKLFEDYEATRQARREYQAVEDSAPTLPHPLFNIKGIVIIVGEFLGAREPRVEVVQDQEDGK